MSRIDEALKRARARGAENPVSPPESVPAPAAPSPSEVFEAPWDFQAVQFEPSPVPAPPAVAPPATTQPLAEPAAETAIRVRPDAPRSSAGGDGASHPAGEAGHSHRPVAPPGVAGTMAVFQGFDPAMIEKLVSTSAAPTTAVEQYRRLAGTLHHAQMERNVKIVMVTSALASEGKTLTATNLALTLSESYRREVLLIDGDLRRPSLHELFQVPNVTGLGDGLKRESEERLSLIKISPHLSLLTAGRPDPDPMSGLTSDRMRRVLEEAASRFDWVIIDTPPVGLLPDANLLAAMVDTALVVIHAARTPYTFVERAIDAIGRDKVIGFILNQVVDEASFTGYHYYKYYTSYSKKNLQ
jgi:protein-tyrosine kinase